MGQTAAPSAPADPTSDVQMPSVKKICGGFKRFVVELLSYVRLFATPWTMAHQALLSIGFSRQEYWSGLPFPSPGHLPDPGIKPKSPASAGGFFTTQLPGNLMIYIYGLLEFHYNTCYYYSDFNVIILFLNLLFIKNNKKNVKNLVGLQDLCQRFLQIDTFC